MTFDEARVKFFRDVHYVVDISVGHIELTGGEFVVVS